MPRYVIAQVMKALNERGKSPKDSRVMVLAVAYKKNIDDVRESPAIRLIELLTELGADVVYHDPFVPQIEPGRLHNVTMRSTELSAETLGECDCVLIATVHDCFDADFIVTHAPLVVDTRNLTAEVKHSAEKVVKS